MFELSERRKGGELVATPRLWARSARQWMLPVSRGPLISDRCSYALTERGTWVNFRDRRNLKIFVEDDPRLFNQYSVILVNPAQHPQVRAEMGMAFSDWLTSSAGQAKMASYKVEGQQLFFPDYRKP